MLKPAYRRHALGIIALVLTAVGVVLFFAGNLQSSVVSDLEAACLRLGPLLAAIWLAYDQLKRIPVWLWVAAPVLVLVLARWPKMLWVLIPLLVAVAVLKPGAMRRR